MQFLHTWQAILEGRKTQTRRRVKPGDMWSTPLSVVVIGRDHGRVIDTIPSGSWPSGSVYAVYNGSRTVYAVGKTYAVQPGRSKPAIARIRITDIRREDVRQISEEDALAEGFEDQKRFWETWIEMHDKTFLETYLYAADCDYLREYGFFERPSARYDAWALSFEGTTGEA